MEPLISVVVPVYNVEKYAETCIRSIINQTYKNLEIILVDDGSTDRSGGICDDLARHDKRIQVIHKENGGLSDARNVGIDRVTGQLIMFVDGDDYIRANAIQCLYDGMRSQEAQISCCQFRFVYEDSQREESESAKDEKFIAASKTEGLVKILKQEYLCSAWGKLYEIELFKDVRYPKGAIFEDLGTTYKLFAKASTIAFSKMPGYCYLMRKGSIQNSTFSIDKMDELRFAREQKEYLDSLFPELELSTTDRLVSSCFHILFSIIGQEEFEAEQKEVEQIIRDNRKMLLLAKETTKKTRYGCLLSYLGFRTEAYIYRILGIRGKIMRQNKLQARIQDIMAESRRK